ncbi:methyl-accepting chemotaxis receptor/sensory transducer with PAS domain [Bradyrhizobium sp. ORS 278]|uniref:methyl-accepting chemotaxis protein n=1 Tax=Bradyrhizobium sp. (strain ORS 278) TaxID=114615 RepID=UPI0001507D1A|nr:PAS domain-containing methyl-accepting chemotaxis protein [Bradyrhizobium sp. ORS 278]CAL75162.1 methyl-accepting chemotaxis receptor/sensory transducer with PAS domain [Bradyrhizobium sp. ORS 278]
MAFWAFGSDRGATSPLRVALDKSLAMMAVAMDGTIISANENCLGALGYTSAEVEGRQHSMLIDPAAQADGSYQKFWDSLRRGEFQSGEFKRIGKGGKTLWIQGTYTPILDRNGKPTKVIKLATDVTAQKARSLENDAIMAALLRSQTAIECKMDGTIITVNQNLLDQLGYTLEEVRGKHQSMFIDPAARDSAEYRGFWATLRAGKHCAAEFKRRAKSGKDVWVVGSWNPILDEKGQPYKVVGFATDVTAQKLEAIDFAGQIEAISKSMAVTEFALDGTILKANKIFLDMMGYSDKEVVGKHHSMFVPEVEHNTPAYREFWSKLRAGEAQTGEFLRMSKDNREVYIHGSYNPIFDLDGKPMKIVKYAYDMTPTVIARQKSGSVRFIIESVADGAENLRTSVRDISDAMDKCQMKTSEAVGHVDAADQQAKQLTAATDAMGGIVELIGNITGQINLLALNATIESARAGDAGRGFAVVASEVKNLANQAKQATDKIGSEIGNLNLISGDVVVALRTIKGAIESVSEYVIASTTAVKEQSEMSEVISGSIRTAASEAAGIVV